MKNILQILLVLNMFLLNSCLENGQLKEADLGKTKLFIINQGDDKAYDDLRNYYLTNKDASSIMLH